jgi:hypothetical protein
LKPFTAGGNFAKVLAMQIGIHFAYEGEVSQKLGIFGCPIAINHPSVKYRLITIETLAYDRIYSFDFCPMRYLWYVEQKGWLILV